jgi:hypothetical protein
MAPHVADRVGTKPAGVPQAQLAILSASTSTQYGGLLASTNDAISGVSKNLERKASRAAWHSGQLSERLGSSDGDEALRNESPGSRSALRRTSASDDSALLIRGPSDGGADATLMPATASQAASGRSRHKTPRLRRSTQVRVGLVPFAEARMLRELARGKLTKSAQSPSSGVTCSSCRVL